MYLCLTLRKTLSFCNIEYVVTVGGLICIVVSLKSAYSLSNLEKISSEKMGFYID